MAEQINGVTSIVDYLTDLHVGTDDQILARKFKKLLAKEMIKSLPWDKAEELINKAKAEAMKETLKKPKEDGGFGGGEGGEGDQGGFEDDGGMGGDNQDMNLGGDGGMGGDNNNMGTEMPTPGMDQNNTQQGANPMEQQNNLSPAEQAGAPQAPQI